MRACSMRQSGKTYRSKGFVDVCCSSHGQQFEGAPEQIMEGCPHGNVDEGQGQQQDEEGEAPPSGTAALPSQPGMPGLLR